VYCVASVSNPYNTLAEIEWYSQWRQYCFMPEMYTVFNDSCLKDIIEFLQWLREEHKQKRARQQK